LIIKDGYCNKKRSPPPENTNEATPNTRDAATTLVLFHKSEMNRERERERERNKVGGGGGIKIQRGTIKVWQTKNV
jgi:hypothetical protein